MSSTARRIIRDMRSNGAVAVGHSSPLQRATDLHGLREANRQRVLNHIRSLGPLVRVTIAEHTGLSRTTVGDTLLKDELTREGSALSAAPSGGRWAILVHYFATNWSIPWDSVIGIGLGIPGPMGAFASVTDTAFGQPEVPIRASAAGGSCGAGGATFP